MKQIYLSAFIVLSSCTVGPIEIEDEHDGAYLLNWTCEEIAEDYRENRVSNPELCEGYDVDGWPIEGAEKRLPQE